MVTIGEFILARVSDDEFLAGHMVRSRVGEVATSVASLGSWDPRRVLAQCAVRRALVDRHQVGVRDAAPCPCGRAGTACPPCHTLRALALEWADHPDYQPEWRAHPVPLQAARTA
jgi:hypothetical protein